jgi:hypothetical protein
MVVADDAEASRGLPSSCPVLPSRGPLMAVNFPPEDLGPGPQSHRRRFARWRDRHLSHERMGGRHRRRGCDDPALGRPPVVRHYVVQLTIPPWLICLTTDLDQRPSQGHVIALLRNEIVGSPGPAHGAGNQNPVNHPGSYAGYAGIGKQFAGGP